MPEKKQVVVIGGGFAGLWAVRRLAHAPVEITLVGETKPSHKGKMDRSDSTTGKPNLTALRINEKPETFMWAVLLSGVKVADICR